MSSSRRPPAYPVTRVCFLTSKFVAASNPSLESREKMWSEHPPKRKPNANELPTPSGPTTLIPWASAQTGAHSVGASFARRHASESCLNAESARRLVYTPRVQRAKRSCDDSHPASAGLVGPTHPPMAAVLDNRSLAAPPDSKVDNFEKSPSKIPHTSCDLVQLNGG